MDPEELRKILKEELSPIIETQQEQGKTLQKQEGMLQEQGSSLQEQRKQLLEQGKELKKHGSLLQKQGALLQEQGEKIDAVIAELHQVHRLADATVDIVKARYEKNKREIDEIKDHLGLPKTPFFGESQ